MGYTAVASSGALFGPEDNLEHVKVYRKPGVAGAVMIALRPVSAGKLLIIKASNDDEQLLQDVKAISKAAAEQVGILKSRAIADILANAKVMDFPLGYIRVDRALGALKMMGYNVIEMTEAAGVGENKVYTLASVTDYRLPMITAFVDSDNTSLVEAKARTGRMGTLTPSLGGSSLASVTDSSAQQRLLIAYDPAAPDSLAGLMDDLQEVIDVPAHQILIEGMIVEVSQDKLRELGVDFSVTDHRVTYSHKAEVVGGTSIKPATVKYSDFVLAPGGFEAQLRLLVENGSADILSKPSILALNNHQARIRIGREMPISTTVSTAATT
ncbi:MAG: hypothetical protein HQ592_02440, partial [Planctomycetes bacterium]|nr:hypothetical protein [Planctomycetota bacterium]